MIIDACAELGESFRSWPRIIASVSPDARFARQTWR
jgi:hypothetical protein